MELASIDFMQLGTSTGGYQYLLVVTENFSYFDQVYPKRGKGAKTAS